MIWGESSSDRVWEEQGGIFVDDNVRVHVVFVELHALEDKTAGRIAGCLVDFCLRWDTPVVYLVEAWCCDQKRTRW
jgi:hypothetical protein